MTMYSPHEAPADGSKTVSSTATAADECASTGHAGSKSTVEDVRAMQRMGQPQELVRHFRTMSMISFTGLAGLAWENRIFTLEPALVNGGRPNSIYSLLWAFVGFIPICLSMAEMASMAPIAGAQYHWVSEFAPERYQKTLSYISGWTSTMAWQAGSASGMFAVGILIQTMITINNPDYTAPTWHAALINMAFIIVALLSNIYGSRALPHWQNAIFAIHVLAFLASVIPVWTLVPSIDHSLVWTRFEDRGGWPHMALAVFVGQLPGIYGQVGLDTAAHMAEEVKNAPVTIPRIMIASFVINFAMDFVTNLTLCYHIPDISIALDDASGYPAMWVLQQAMSRQWFTVLLFALLVLCVFGELAYFAAVSRDLYAFARDEGVPFSSWVATVDKKRHIPVNAYLVSAATSAILSLLYIGSSVAFFAIVSLCSVALLQCYLFSIGCVLWRRIHAPDTLPLSRFSLGRRWGILLNSCAVIFSSWCFFWSFWPDYYHVTTENFNWATVIFVATLIVAAVYYAAGGRKKYRGPVVLVEGRKAQ